MSHHSNFNSFLKYQSFSCHCSLSYPEFHYFNSIQFIPFADPSSSIGVHFLLLSIHGRQAVVQWYIQYHTCATLLPHPTLLVKTHDNSLHLRNGAAFLSIDGELYSLEGLYCQLHVVLFRCSVDCLMYCCVYYCLSGGDGIRSVVVLDCLLVVSTTSSSPSFPSIAFHCFLSFFLLFIPSLSLSLDLTLTLKILRLSYVFEVPEYCTGNRYLR